MFLAVSKIAAEFGAPLNLKRRQLADVELLVTLFNQPLHDVRSGLLSIVGAATTHQNDSGFLLGSDLSGDDV